MNNLTDASIKGLEEQQSSQNVDSREEQFIVEINKEREHSAMVIQRAWRRHIDVQVYRYYRDLINFKQKGDPALMLRCINPIEAKMLDSAAGIHIRFRLGGDRFPPNIYYKIFTHRPVTDMCANSPKDYTSAACRKQHTRTLHNNLDRAAVEDGAGWYRRSENNGWRLVADKVVGCFSDPVMWSSARKQVDFHHDRLQRKEEVEKKRKEKKIDWMKKMYRDGMLQARAADAETVALIEGAARGMVLTAEAEGGAALQDWEVDELLDWTTALNFDEYQQGWKAMATSAGSEAWLNTEPRARTTSDEAFELAATTEASLYGRDSAHVSNTPMSSPFNVLRS